MSVPTSSTAPAEHLEQAETRPTATLGRPVGGRYGRFFVVLFVLGFLANMMAVITPVAVALSLKLLAIAPSNTASAQALVLGVGAVFAAVANPIGGFLSDRSTSRFGRRRPFLVAGTVIGTLGLILMGSGTTVPVVLVGWCVTQGGFNIVFAVLYGLLADAFPATSRGKISGFIGLGQAVGIAGGVVLANVFTGRLTLTFIVPGVIAVVVLTILAIIAPDRAQSRSDLERTSVVKFLAGFWVSPRKHPDYAWAWAGRFLIIFAQTAPTSFTVLFLVSRLGFTPANVASIVLVNTLLGLGIQVISAPVGGWLSDKLHRRKIFVLISTLIGAAGLVMISTAGTLPMFLLGSAIFQFGISAYLAVDLALVTDVLPNGGREAGKHLGVLALASTVPQSLAPAVAPLFLSIGGPNNYTALFMAAALIGVVGAITVLPIKSVK